jgi:hypothetical protein
MEELDKQDGIHAVEEDNIAPPPHYRPDGPPQVITSDTSRPASPGFWSSLFTATASEKPRRSPPSRV